MVSDLKEKRRGTATHRRKGHVKTDTGVMQPEAKNCQQPPDAGREAWILPWSLQREPPLSTPWFWTSGLQNRERINFCCLRCQVHGNLLWQPSKINTAPKCVSKLTGLSLSSRLIPVTANFTSQRNLNSTCSWFNPTFYPPVLVRVLQRNRTNRIERERERDKRTFITGVGSQFWRSGSHTVCYLQAGEWGKLMV